MLFLNSFHWSSKKLYDSNNTLRGHSLVAAYWCNGEPSKKNHWPNEWTDLFHELIQKDSNHWKESKSPFLTGHPNSCLGRELTRFETHPMAVINSVKCYIIHKWIATDIFIYTNAFWCINEYIHAVSTHWAAYLIFWWYPHEYGWMQ